MSDQKKPTPFNGDLPFSQNHVCTQEVTLNTICLKLEAIEITVAEIRRDQTEYLKEIQAIRIMEARYPTPEEFDARGKTIDRHDTLFKITGSALVVAWGLLLFCVDKLWRS
jgi:hypothetical protein